MDIKTFASMGGKARQAKLTKEQRHELASKAIYKRWNKPYQQASIEPVTINPFKRCKVCNTKYCNHTPNFIKDLPQGIHEFSI